MLTLACHTAFTAAFYKASLGVAIVHQSTWVSVWPMTH